MLYLDITTSHIDLYHNELNIIVKKKIKSWTKSYLNREC